MPRKLLFAVDHRFEIDENGTVFTLGGKFPARVWGEYLAHFDEVVVAARGGRISSSPSKLSVSSAPKVRHLFLGGRRGVARLTELAAQRKILRAEIESCDAVVGRLPSEVGLTACGIARELGKPVLTEVVACAWDALWFHGSAVSRLYAPVLEWRTRQAVGAAPLARYVTHEFLQKHYPCPGERFVASNVALEAFDETRAFRDAALWSQRSGITFGTIGSLVSKMKGIHIALEALSKARADLPPFQYRVLGEGDPEPYRNLAASLGLADVVHFDGVLPAGAAVAEWLDGVDVYLQPSFQEGLPRAVIEALSRGCLAVASSAGGTPELLPPSRIHKPGDVDGLALMIRDQCDRDANEKAEESIRNVRTAKRYEASKLVEARGASIRALAAMSDRKSI
jgi:glycosyltransferase involved in cell wall biosynthesis